jgi:putative addiction module component (TIGR02574 family)
VSSYDSVLSAATQLPEQDRLRLIDALWETVPPEVEAPLSSEWLAEIERRMDDLGKGRGKTVSWSDVRGAAMGRLRHGENH